MKTSLFVLGLLATATLATTVAAPPARAQTYPWCAYYAVDFGGSNCGFSTYEQCMEDISGIGGFCQKNDWYHPSAEAAPHYNASGRKHRHPQG
jgi:hypothetical protein